MKKSLMEFWVRLTADPKKSGALGLLVVMGLGMWVRALVLSKSSDNSSSVVQSSVMGDGFSEHGDKGKEGTREIGVITLPELVVMTRDLFAPDEEHFPLPRQTELLDTQPAKSSTGTDEKTSEHQESAQQLANRVGEELGRLRLRSTIVGMNPIAIIELHESRARGEGRVLRVGEKIAGFRLLEIFSRRVSLEKEGVRVELELESH